MPRSSTSSRSSPHSSLSKYKPSTVVPYTPHIEQPTLGQTVKQGFGLGVGSGIGHVLVGRVFGVGSPTAPTVSPHQTSPPKKETCEFERKVFENCLINHRELCHNEQLSLTECLKLSKKDLE